MRVELHAGPFDPWHELARHQSGHLRSGAYGATAAFTGTMRDFNDDASVSELFIEHYPGMTERELERILTEATERHGLQEGIIHHRVGSITVGEPIVLVAVWSAHRAAAFDACREIMEDLKSRAPFWKKEARRDGGHWVESNTPG